MRHCTANTVAGASLNYAVRGRTHGEPLHRREWDFSRECRPPRVPSARMGGEQPLFQRRLQELRDIGDPKLLHHVGPVGLRRLDADMQLLSDRSVRQPRPDQLQNFLLSRGQIFRTAPGHRAAARHSIRSRRNLTQIPLPTEPQDILIVIPHHLLSFITEPTHSTVNEDDQENPTKSAPALASSSTRPRPPESDSTRS
ncbi:hypothetical protein NSPZN2_10253 [Nitrospira defluvii]|uniref:Uncharacterized protein n=1 Tax=Nitrospira defluvii TaxID=330214 RepID=A0ABM8QDR7_9BACT|nr:hypothetical protein NSPZN2_10253 [Nitrospira defluvii]